MGFMKTAIGATVLVAATVGMASAATDREIMEGRAAKYARRVSEETRLKGLCVCQNGGSAHAAVGQLVLVDGGASADVYCLVNYYHPSGSVSGIEYCYTYGNWALAVNADFFRAHYGATGYTGRRVVAELRRRGFAPVLAGRDAARLEAVAAEHGGDEVHVARLGDARALEASSPKVGSLAPGQAFDAREFLSSLEAHGLAVETTAGADAAA